MSIIHIPIDNHINGLHNGHQQIIKFAKSFSGDPVIRVIGNAAMWRNHLLTGGPFATEFIHTKMKEDAEKEKCKIELANLMKVPESWRVLISNKAKALISLYDEALILDSYKQRATAMIMGILAFKQSTVDSTDIIVRGPEVVAFFQESVRKLIGGPEIKIYSDIIKDPLTHIKAQGAIDKVVSSHRKDIYRLHSVIGGAKENYKIGRNDKLVQELNNSYSMKIWTIKNIVVYEGGMIPGRMEVVQFSFPSNTGTVIIEDINYIH